MSRSGGDHLSVHPSESLPFHPTAGNTQPWGYPQRIRGEKLTDGLGGPAPQAVHVYTRECRLEVGAGLCLCVCAHVNHSSSPGTALASVRGPALRESYFVTHTHTSVHSHIHRRAHTHRYVPAYTDVRIHRHLHTHVHTHINTHTGTYTQATPCVLTSIPSAHAQACRVLWILPPTPPVPLAPPARRQSHLSER